MSSRFVPGDDFDFYPDIDESLHPNKRQRGSGYPVVNSSAVHFPPVEYEDYPYNNTKTHQINFKGTADTLHWPPYFFLIDKDNYLRAKLDENGKPALSDRLVKMPFPSGGTGEGAGATCANVLNFDAVGDGVDDDTQAFKDALSESSCIFVPRGTFKITESLPIPTDSEGRGRLRITGAGTEYSTILVQNNPLIKFSGTTPDQYDIEIDNVRLYNDEIDTFYSTLPDSLGPVLLDFTGQTDTKPIQVGRGTDDWNQFRRRIVLSGVWFRHRRNGSGSCVKVQDCLELRIKNCMFQHENWDLHGPVKESTTEGEDGNTITLEQPEYSISSPLWVSRTNGQVYDNLFFMVVPGTHKMRAVEVDDSVKVIPDEDAPNCDCAAGRLFQGDLVIESNRFLAYRQRFFPIRSLFKQRDLIKGTEGRFLGQATGVHVEGQDDRTISKVVARNNLAEVFLKESFADLQDKRMSVDDYDAQPDSMKEAVRFQCFPGYVMDRRDHMAMNDNWFNVGKTYEWPEYKELRDGAEKALEFLRFQVDSLTSYAFIEGGGNFTPSIASERTQFSGAGGAQRGVDLFGTLPYEFQDRLNNQNSTVFSYSLDGTSNAYWGVKYNIGKDPAAGGGRVTSGPGADFSTMKLLHFIAWDPSLDETTSTYVQPRFVDSNLSEQVLVDVNDNEKSEVEITNQPQEFTLFQKDNVKNNFAGNVYDLLVMKVVGESNGKTAAPGDRQLALAGVYWRPTDPDDVTAVPKTNKNALNWETGVFIKSWTTYSESIPSEPDTKRPREFDIILNNVAFIYDNALAAFALLGTNDPTDRLRALAIGNALQKAPFLDQDYSYEVTRNGDGSIDTITYVNDTQNDGRMRNAYQWGPALKPRCFYYLYDGTSSQDPDQDGKRWVKMGVPFWTVRTGYDDITNEEKVVGSSAGEINVDAYQISFWLGNSTWACMLLNGLANVIYSNGRIPDDDNRSRSYRDACLKNLEFHEFMRSETDMGGFHGGYIKLFEPGGADVDQFDFFRLGWKSVEHGTDIISYGHQLLNLIGPHHPDWLRIKEGILRHASKFVYRHFADVYEPDPQGGYGEQRRKTVYYTGGGDADPNEVEDAERKYMINKNNIPLDVLLWAIQAQYKMFYPQNQAMSYALRYMTTDGSPASLAKYSEPSGEGWIEGTGQLAVTLHCMGQKHLADKKLHSCLTYLRGKNGGFWSTTGVASTGFTLPGSTNLWKYYPDEHLGATAWWLMGWYGVNPYQYPNDELEMVGTVPRFTNEPRYTDKLVIGGTDKSTTELDKGDLYVRGSLSVPKLCLTDVFGDKVCLEEDADNRVRFRNETQGTQAALHASGLLVDTNVDINNDNSNENRMGSGLVVGGKASGFATAPTNGLWVGGGLDMNQTAIDNVTDISLNNVLLDDNATPPIRIGGTSNTALGSGDETVLMGDGVVGSLLDVKGDLRINTFQQGDNGDLSRSTENGGANWNETYDSIKNDPPKFKVGDIAAWAANGSSNPVKTEKANSINGFRSLKIGTYIRGQPGNVGNSIASAKNSDGTGDYADVVWDSSVSSLLFDGSAMDSNTGAGSTRVVIPGTWQVLGQVSGLIDNQQIGNGFTADIYIYLIQKVSDNDQGKLY